jgi:hypothetical protein
LPANGVKLTQEAPTFFIRDGPAIADEVMFASRSTGRIKTERNGRNPGRNEVPVWTGSLLLAPELLAATTSMGLDRLMIG